MIVACTALTGVLVSSSGSPARAADQDVVITELMYHAPSDLDEDDFVELTNIGSSPVDVTGWTFSKGVSGALPSRSIPPGGRIVIAKDATRFQATYGFAPAGVYGGNLSNGGEEVAIKNAGGTVVDSVTYDDARPWAITPDGGGPSLELIDPTLDNSDWLNWAASTAAAGHTAGAVNSVAGSGLGPRITDVQASPQVPNANQSVTVTATITGADSATLRYRKDFASEQTVSMAKSGDSYSATISGVAAGHLIRYRVEAGNSNRSSRVPRVDDTVNYDGVVANSGITTQIAMLEWFIADADYNAITSEPTVDIERQAVVAYGGNVIDNVTVNIRGATTQKGPKPSWKFEMPQGHDLDMPGYLVEPVDEFAMQGDYSDHSHGRPLLAWEAYRMAGVVDAQVFPLRTQKNGQFLGLYTYVDLFDGTWRSREGYDADQFFKASTKAFDESKILANVRFEKKNPGDEDYTPLRAFLDGLLLNGAAERNFLLANADIPQMINYAAVTAIIEHPDSSSKNFYLTQDPDTLRWSVLPWDLDHTWGNSCCQQVTDFVTPAEPADQTSPLMVAILAVPEWREMYFRRLRTLVDEILAPGLLQGVYDAKVGPAQPEHDLDRIAFGKAAWTAYANQRTQLFNQINGRRTTFNTDSRVPNAQPASPVVVINQVQPMGAYEYVELRNPTGQAIDVSGWSIPEIGLQIQPGAVVVGNGTMRFVNDDPAYRANYGGLAFVGGTYGNALADGGGTLTLVRTDASVADTETYGAVVVTEPDAPTIGNATAGDGSATARWTAPAGNGGSAISGYEVQVLDSSEAQVGALRPAGAGATSLTVTGLTNGTPYHFRVRATNSVGPGPYSGSSNVVTPTAAPLPTQPDAPTIGNATAGDAAATARWTAPSDDGGSPITGYEVRVLDGSETQVGALRPAGASATSLLVSGLANGTAYHFEVRALNGVGPGAYSAPSNAVTPTAAPAGDVPGAPGIRSARPGTAGGAITATARWNAPGSTGGSPITGYQVTAFQKSTWNINSAVLSTTVSAVVPASARQLEMTLPAAGIYRFTVVAINANGPSVPSALSSGTRGR